MHEFYDEIVFTNPSPHFFTDLMKYTSPAVEKRPITHLTVCYLSFFFYSLIFFQEHYSIFDENINLQHLLTIQQHLKAQIEGLYFTFFPLIYQLIHWLIY